MHREEVGAIRRLAHTLLTEHGVEEAFLVLRVIIKLLHEQRIGIHAVNPLELCIRLQFVHRMIAAFTRCCIDEHRALNIRAAEEANGFILNRADPIRLAFFIDLKIRLRKHKGRVLEAQVAHQITVEVLCRRILDAALHALNLSGLRDQVNDDIAWQAIRAVGEPFNQVGVFQRNNAHRRIFIVNLRVFPHIRHHIDLKLRDKVA